LVADARRHGVTVLGPDVNRSEALVSLEPGSGGGAGEPVVRLGITSVKGIGTELAEQIGAGRPYTDLEDLARRTGANRTVLESLATAGAVSGLAGSGAVGGSGVAGAGGSGGSGGRGRREALWAAGAAAESRADRLPGVVTGTDAPPLPPMNEVEEMAADLQTLGLSPHSSPMTLARPQLERLGAVPIASLLGAADGERVTIAGIVTHRQRPATAGGVTFLNVEDETGLVNVICSAGLWIRYRRAARSAVVMLVRGRLERAAGAHPEAPSGANLVAEYLEEVDFTLAVTPSRDYR